MRTPCPALILVLAAGAVAALATPAGAQTPGLSAGAMSFELLEAQRAHLSRVARWGAASLVVGLGLVTATRSGRWPAGRGFGIQAAVWGAINLTIVAWTFGTGFGAPATTVAGALAAEDGYGNMLLLNVGLNVGYTAVGVTLAVVASHGVARARSVRGHGLGLAVQGLGLLVLNGITWAGSLGRMELLRLLVEQAAG